MTIKIYISAVILLFQIGCNSSMDKEKVTLSFDGFSFTLPCKVSEIKNKGGFKYNIYRGFRGKTENYITVLQIDNYPLWVNSENVIEEFYSNKKVIGVTFISEIDRVRIENVIEDLSKQYSLSFTKFINTDFEYAKAKNGFFITVSKKKNNYYISFYKGISKKEIPNYVNNVW